MMVIGLISHPTTALSIIEVMPMTPKGRGFTKVTTIWLLWLCLYLITTLSSFDEDLMLRGTNEAYTHLR